MPGLEPGIHVFSANGKKDVDGRHEPAMTKTQTLVAQFFVLSTSAPFLIHGIMSRSFSPTCSIGWVASFARVALNEVWLTLFSSIQSRANLPDWMSLSTRFISFLVSSVTMRGPVTYSPYSAVLEIE